MRDSDCVAFLQWALPRLQLHWPGFRKVRKQVCKRVARRSRELALDGLTAYRDYMEKNAEEWIVLDKLCRVTISRFCRDRLVFDALGTIVLPHAAEKAHARGNEVRCWSAGCASGEEVYSLKIVWEQIAKAKSPGASMSILGTDIDETVLRRARTGCYKRSTLREIRPEWLDVCFDRQRDLYCIKDHMREGIRFCMQDVRSSLPSGRFDIILCRNLVFTYFEPKRRQDVLRSLSTRLRHGGFLVIGAHEELPNAMDGFRPLEECRQILRFSG